MTTSHFDFLLRIPMISKLHGSCVYGYMPWYMLAWCLELLWLWMNDVGGVDLRKKPSINTKWVVGANRGSSWCLSTLKSSLSRHKFQGYLKLNPIRKKKRKEYHYLHRPAMSVHQLLFMQLTPHETIWFQNLFQPISRVDCTIRWKCVHFIYFFEKSEHNTT